MENETAKTVGNDANVKTELPTSIIEVDQNPATTGIQNESAYQKLLQEKKNTMEAKRLLEEENKRLKEERMREKEDLKGLLEMREKEITELKTEKEKHESLIRDSLKLSA